MASPLSSAQQPMGPFFDGVTTTRNLSAAPLQPSGYQRRFYRHRRAAAGDGFFKILDRVRRLGVMFWPRRQFAIVHRPQFPAHRLDRDDDAVFLEHPLAEIDKPPAYDAVHGGDRAIL